MIFLKYKFSKSFNLSIIIGSFLMFGSLIL